ncbi:surface-like protein [Methylococcus geothermalis]|uniref:surface-like protein n=1 Tax=Methylococcus geothermalis TaxID=2681310 RepID=UPI001E584C9B|nr:surface-like protein [Methylococcus geothermalis]
MWQPAKAPEQPVAAPPRDYAAMDLDALVRYSEDLSKMTPAERLPECQQVDRMQASNPRMGYRLHLLLAQMVTDGCGDASITLGNIRVVANEIEDGRVRGWLAYLGELVSRSNQAAAEKAELDKQLKEAQSGKHKVRKDAKAKDSKIQSLENEVEELRSKLNTLKSIEQKL